jgi:tRNA (cytidine/uridine-2'-O-)-methyltransferase
MDQLHVVLFEPEIPQNTGAIARLCAAVGARLHLIEPLGFSVDDRALKRAGLDYWHLVEVAYHRSLDEFLKKRQGKTLNFITKTGTRPYDRIDCRGEVYLVFGKETTGLPPHILDAYRERCYRVPMRAEARSLNLANAVAVVAYEACRRTGFDRLKLDGSQEFTKR